MICLVLTIFANLFPAGEHLGEVGAVPGRGAGVLWSMPEASTPAAYSGVNERTFLAVKPDGVQRRLVGEIVRRFERKGFKLVALKLVQVWARKGEVDPGRESGGSTVGGPSTGSFPSPRPLRSYCGSIMPSCVRDLFTAD